MTESTDKETPYYVLENGKEIFMEEVALINLLQDCVVFPCDAISVGTEERMIGLAVNANDLFLPGGDVEVIALSDLEEFYGYYRKHDIGPAIWMSLRRDASPRTRIWEAMNGNNDLWELFPKEMKRIGELHDKSKDPN